MNVNLIFLFGAQLPASRRDAIARLATDTRPEAQALCALLESSDDRHFAAFLRDASIDRLVRDQDSLQRARALATRLGGVDTTAFGLALRSFTDVSMAPAQRRQVLATAAGEPLSTAAREVVVALAEAIPDGALPAAGAATEKRLKPSGRLESPLAQQWFAPFLRSDLAAAGTDLEKLKNTAGTPAFQRHLEQALDIVRVIGKVEADNLERIAIGVPDPKWREAIREAIVAHARELSIIGSLALGSSEEGAQRLDSLVGALLAIALAKDETATTPEEQRARLLRGVEALAKAAEGFDPTAAAESTTPPVEVAAVRARVDASNRRFLARLESHAVQMTPEARAALHDLVEDTSSCALMMGCLAQMAGAIANPEMTPDERAAKIQRAAELMGPIFIKLLQTIVNQQAVLGPILNQHAGGEEGAAVVHEALKRLQDRVTPMNEADTRAQVERELGKKIEDVFVSFDLTPFASASIGQAHRATLMRDGEPTEVVVKVQRIGLEKEFEKTQRVTRLTLAVLQQALPTIPNLSERDRAAFTQLLSTVDVTLDGFIDSFRAEMDFSLEARNLNDFREDSGIDPYVTAPQIFEDLCTRGVLTMEFIRGEKLSSVLQRYETAAQARAGGPIPNKPLDAGTDTRRQVVERARLWAKQTYGIEPTDVDCRLADRGYIFTVKFDHPTVKRASAHIGWQGKITPPADAPHLDAAGLAALRDRLVASFLAQALVHGLVHGDLHQGNFMVLGDARTVVLLDFGNVVRLDRRDVKLAGQFALAMRMKRAGEMAKILVDLADTPPQGAQRMQIEAELTSAFDKAIDAANKRVAAGSMAPQRNAVAVQAQNAGASEPARRPQGFGAEDILEVITSKAMRLGLTISPVYLQAMKTTISMTGNLAAFAEAGIDGNNVALGARAGRRLALDSTARFNPSATRIKNRKASRVQRLNAGIHE